MPRHPIGRTWWVRVPGFVVAIAALNRASWLHSRPESIGGHWWVEPYALVFAAVGALNLVWHLSAPWRAHTGTPWVALATFLAWATYAMVIVESLGWARVRATALDLLALALVIAWSWGPEREPV